MPGGFGGRLAALAIAGLVAVLLAACGGGSNSSAAQSLLRQTFAGSHAVRSGVLTLDLTLTPTGSSTLHGPISLGLSGPFQSRGSGQLPASDLTISIDALGHHGQLGIVSTGSSGYVVLRGVAYRLPAADYQRLGSSFAGVGGAGGGLTKLGIEPLHWLTHPSIVGRETIAGTATTHVRAGVNVAALLADLSAFLQRASSSTPASSLPGALSASARAKIAAEVSHPTVDVWTGSADKTLRRLAIGLSIPVHGQISSLLGGLSEAGIGITVQYADLNQPQTISAPANVQPYSKFAPQLQSILGKIQGRLGASGLGASAGG